MFQTKLHMSSVGIVAEDKKINSNTIKVYPIEYLPTFDGELTPTEASLNSTGVDLNENEYTVSLNVTNVIEANWLSLATNRETPPDVVKGEQVILWSYADAEGYYWTSMGRDDNLRKLETAVYTFSDIPDNSGEEIKGQNNQYTVEVSTHGKHITIKTCKNDQEPFAYTLQINAKDGCVFLTDDVSNFITLDSKNTNIKAKNKNGTFISLNKDDMFISAPNNIDVKAGKNYTLKAGNDINIEAGRNYTLKVGGDAKAEIEKNYTLKVGEDTNIKLEKNYTLKVGGDTSIKLEKNYTLKVKENLNTEIGKKYTLKVGDDVNIESGKNYTLKVGGNLNTELGKKYALKAGDGLNIESGSQATISSGSNMNISAGSAMAIKASSVSFGGNVNVQGAADFSSSVNAASMSATSMKATSMSATDFHGNFYGTLFGSIA